MFDPSALLAASRGERGLALVAVPAVCVLDPDGDLAAHAAVADPDSRHRGWACYHTAMSVLSTVVGPVGIVGCAVGAPFAVLVAEQLAASGAELVISLSSAGRVGSGPSEGGGLLLIDRALRDEGTSGHYLPPARWSVLSRAVAGALDGAFDGLPFPVGVGSSWTTDAPYRETAQRVAAAAAAGAVCVEMEAAGLYAYAEARGRQVVCLAQLTNAPGSATDTFDKGVDRGVQQAIAAITAIVLALHSPAENRPVQLPADPRGPTVTG